MKKILFVLAAAVALFTACKKTEDLEAPRLFRPQGATTALAADSNTIVANWLKVSGAKSYMLQLSRDTFRTIDQTLTLDTNTAVIKKLLYNQLYQVQVKAIAPDTAMNSRWSSLGGIKTLSSILQVPSASDITFNAVRVKWTTKGAPVTAIKIIKTADSSVVSQVNLTAADRAAESRVITGLTAASKYTIFLYSDADARGYVDFTTAAPLSGVVIDLTGFTGRPTLLADTLAVVPTGATILLKRGETYTLASSITLSKAVTIASGPDLTVTTQARINVSANFTVANGVTVDYIDFKDVYLVGAQYSGTYVFNTASSGVTATIGRISFEDCRAEIFRGLVRTQSTGGVNIGNFVVNRSIVDSIAGYGLITVDNAAGKVDNIAITNSTIYKAEKVLTSKSNSVSILIDNCTFNEAPLGNSSSYYIDYNGVNVTGASGITVSNSIFGFGKYSNGAITVRDVRYGTATNINTSNNFRTADHLTAAASNDFPNISTSNRTAAQLWTDPANGNFKIADATFSGRTNAGDPRWRQ